MRFAPLVFATLLAASAASSAAFAAKVNAPYASQTDAAVRGLRDRQRATGVTLLGAMRSVRRIAQTTGKNQAVPLGPGLEIRSIGIGGGKFGVSLDETGVGTIVGSTGGRLPSSGHVGIGQRVLQRAPSLTTATVDTAMANFLSKHGGTP